MKSYPSSIELPLILDRSPEYGRPAPDAFAGMSSSDRAPREEVLHRAYAIWENEGHPDGRQLAHWLEAEAEVMRHA